MIEATKESYIVDIRQKLGKILNNVQTVESLTELPDNVRGSLIRSLTKDARALLLQIEAKHLAPSRKRKA